MAKRGALSKANLDTFKTRPLHLDFERQPEPIGPAPHLAEHVRKWLVDWADRNDYNLYSDGLVIHTTIDSRMQAYADHAVARRTAALQAISDADWGVASGRQIAVQSFGKFWKTRGSAVDAFVRESAAYRNALAAGTAPDKTLAVLKSDAAFMAKLRAEKMRLETGFVAIDPSNGHVKAWVGSRDFAVDQFDHVAQARRQPGSTFKPFVYGAALEQGMPSDRRFTDEAVEIPMSDGTVWRPTDASPATGREMTAREGLIYSRNTITAKVMQEVGPKSAANFARRLGVNQSKLEPVPALALGTSPVTLLEMVSAYSTIASGGEYRKPILVSRIADKDGNVLETVTSDGKRALSDKTAHELTDMMRGVVNQGTGRGIRTQFGIQADVAGKTGTTQNNTDGWFILMHPRLVAGSWVGFNDARVTMRNDYWGQGAHTALPIVGDFYRQSLHARLVESGARFPEPKASFFASLLESVYDLLGWKKDEPAPQPSRPRPAAPLQAPVPDNVPMESVTELERIMTQAQDAAPLYADESRVSTEVPNEHMGTMADVPANGSARGSAQDK
jgi:penicillin-binding protein 1A